MTGFPTVRVAAIQATPAILDAKGSIEKAIGLLAEAAADGARLAALPEAYVPLYPSNSWAKEAASFSGWDELWERLWESSVDVPGPLTDRLAEACREHDLICGIGINERESERPGTLYNAYLLIGADGVLHRHRKLMPTMQERIFHGIGAGDDLAVVATDAGRIGGLICWENRMPLARYALYRQGRLDAAHRARVRRLRHLGPAVHPSLRLPRRLPGAAASRARGLRQRRRRDRRARRGRGDRRPALRRGGDRRRRLRPADRPSRQALVRRGRPLRPRGRPRRSGGRGGRR
jgi:carbon-nitrogen hydrolase